MPRIGPAAVSIVPRTMPSRPMNPTPIKPTHKAILAYYAKLAEYASHGATHETAVSTAFGHLLGETAKARGWTLIPQETLHIRGKSIRPDGTAFDEWKIPRGYWEAKDTDDDLDVEIRKKVSKGYPLVNIIFEDTRKGVLFQNGSELLRAKLDDPVQLAELLNQFYAHTERDIDGFEQAVAEFKEQVPRLAVGLLERIESAHQAVPKFQRAFDGLMELCRNALNPNIRAAAVDEMLVQHLLTERLFRTVFDNADFVKRNVIAREIETVIEALVSKSFNRGDFLKKIDPFYKAIEDKARTIDDFAQKQHFLNTVYERFFQGYSVKVADTHGIVYTPQPIVDFMCASVQEVLKAEFGLDLGDETVHILDPCTGTGNFIVNLLRRVPKRNLARAYREGLFANEVMLLPYYIAAQNIEHAYFEMTGTYEPFEGLCFVDTLELAEAEQGQLAFMTEENTARVEREKKAQINVIIGNPPYNVGQLNENDNNKNRKYPLVEERIRRTYTRESTASNKNSLSDTYVKFFSWAENRLLGQPGVVCFVTNNGFVNGIAFDGFRKTVSQNFDLIYHLDLKGNARTTAERRRREGGNVFNDMVRVGVGITILVRLRERAEKRLRYAAVEDYWNTDQKQAHLEKFNTLSRVSWRTLSLVRPGLWMTPESLDEYETFPSIGSKGAKADLSAEVEVIFKNYGGGVKTCRDYVVYGYDRVVLAMRISSIIENYNAEVNRLNRSSPVIDIDNFVKYKEIKWSRDLKADLFRGRHAFYNVENVRPAMYRPFCRTWLYFDKILNEEVYNFPVFLPNATSENILISLTAIGSEWPFVALASGSIVDLHFAGVGANSTQCFPFYVYDEDGTNRRENITDWALDQFRERYDDPSITKWDIFHYVYGVLHQPAYRIKFADNLRRELPRVPFRADFRAFAEAGRGLAEVHVGYEAVEPWPLEWVVAEGGKLSFAVEKMKLSKDKTALVVNDSLTLVGIPPEVFDYRLGNRSALDWVIDQYRVTTDKRSGIVSDPNRKDDPESIVRLVERVVRVSVETVKIVAGLPDEG